MDTILVVNAGSSSVKFQVYEVDAQNELKRLIKGQVDGIGSRPRLRGETADGKSTVDRTFSTEQVADVPAAIHAAGGWLREQHSLEPSAVGHRVVHGGPELRSTDPGR